MARVNNPGLQRRQLWYFDVKLHGGAIGDGVADDSAAFELAIASGLPIWVPRGTYLISRTLAMASGMMLVGAGKNLSVLKSSVIGGSLLHTTASSVSGIYMSDLRLAGNGVVGSGGNGHGLDLIDPTINSGTHSPQNSTFERLHITGFKGFGRWDNGGGLVESCGVAQIDGVQNVFRDVTVENCGHGFLFYLAQNMRLESCTAIDCMKWGIFSYATENLVIDKAAVMACGDGIESTGYGGAGLLTGLVLSYANSGFVMQGSKLKNNGGKAAFVSKFSDGDLVQGNWIRGDSLTDSPHKAVYAERTPGIRIIGNTFSPSMTGFAATQKYEQIELHATQTNEVFSATIRDNTFENLSGMGIAYNIRVGGNSNVRKYGGVTISGNEFGTRKAASSPGTVDADILIESSSLQDSVIANNSHVASSNVTRTACVKATSATLAGGNRIGPSTMVANSGAITAEYVGLARTVSRGSVAATPGTLADDESTATATIPVDGAAIGDSVSATYSAGLQGVEIVAWVSASGTVSYRFLNRTGGSVTLASGTVTARVEKSH